MEPSRSCWNSTTSALQPEEITLKWTSFIGVLSIKVPIRKKSGNLSNDPRSTNLWVRLISLKTISIQLDCVQKKSLKKQLHPKRRGGGVLVV